ncbi:MAG: putative endopeptidase [Phenylobacterium sp.]|jgi:putative endopeptidase
MRKLVTCGFCGLFAAMLVACGDHTEHVGTLGVDTNNFDTSVRPQDNFYQYANGGWLKKQTIPPDRTAVGALYTMRENSREDVLNIIKTLAAKNNLEAGSDEQKVADLYRAFMNVNNIEKQALNLLKSPLNSALSAIDAISNRAELMRYFATSQINGLSNTPLKLYIGVDAKVSSQYRAHLWQGGLFLPNRDYYLKQAQHFVDIRQDYVKHITKMFTLAGFDQPQVSAKRIMAMETTLATGHWNKLDNRDSEKRYHKFAINDLNQVSAQLDWTALLTAYGVIKRVKGIGDETEVIINQPSFVKTLGQLVAQASLQDWKTYLRWGWLNSRASQLSAALDAEHFHFFAKTLNGQSEQQPRWKRAVDTVNHHLGGVIGKIYVKRHFTAKAKTKMINLVENLRKAYGQSIDDLQWMSASTKQAAQDKLAKFDAKIGYPNHWKNYRPVAIKADDLVGNLTRTAQFKHQQSLNKLGGPIDRTEWHLNPQTVNAYYNPTKNEIVFPAAILQPPFFNLDADDAVNYGGIGAVIGHEMGHGFDDQGSKYDGDGNLRNWWSESDLKEFTHRSKALVKQFNGYKVFDDLTVNGELTLGENIGDLAGITIAYKAYRLSLNGQRAPIIDGFTGDQRFFLGFAQIWQGKMKEKTLRKSILNNPHPPVNFRALGALSNMPEFYSAFDVKEGDAMYIAPEKRVKIW